MLVELAVEDFAIVERARFEPAAGFTALTGETGAGKSLLVGALSLLVGGRAGADAVRAGQPRARIEARFLLERGPAARRARALLDEWGVPCDDGEVVVRREIAREGRSRAWVNETPVTLAALADLGASLLDVHGQHEHQSLLAPERQRELLDRWAGLDADLEAHAARHAAWRLAAEERSAFEIESSRALAEAEMWTFAHEELSRAALVAGEDEVLASKLARMRHAGRFAAALGRARAALGGGDDAARGAVHDAAEAERAVAEAAGVDPSLAALVEELGAARATLTEALSAVEAASSAEDLDPAEAEATEARHALLERLSRKYHRTIPELIAYRDELAARLARAGDSDAERARLADAEAAARKAVDASARSLTKQRGDAARKLAKRIPGELSALGLGRASIDIALEPLDAPAAHGADRIEFRFTPNPGEGARPLAKIASGGELSRVMLALKTLLAGEDGVDTLLFDEVDAGIGGAVAGAVGERLAALGRVRQVLCVTHLPVVAARAERQFEVAKSTAGGRTRATVGLLEGDARVDALARMLAGDAATATSRRQARELLELGSRE